MRACRRWRILLRPRRRRRHGDHRWPLAAASLAGITLAILLIYTLDGALRPMIRHAAQAKAKNAVSMIINDAVDAMLEQQAVTYQDVITLEKDNGGQITALTSNTAEMNRLRTALMADILERIDALDSTDLGIPLGDLTGLSLLSHRGPVLPVEVHTAAAAGAEFQNVFTSAGINQTYHQVMLDITVEVDLLLPGGETSTSVHTQVCVAETVLVGEVPQTYLQLTPGQT